MSDKTQRDFFLCLEPCWLKDTYSDGGNDFPLKHNYVTSSKCLLVYSHFQQAANMDY